ncbi:hypothetical protein HanIR_Chr16g0810081 [Helianthus annuus]|nr:hypothetical protein HanIR_Chr16g0810081 [Helianthus annuus]
MTKIERNFKGPNFPLRHFKVLRFRALQVGIRAQVLENQVIESKCLNSNRCALVIKNPYNPRLDRGLNAKANVSMY